jgi:Leucine-rich repeat (LRR) protein
MCQLLSIIVVHVAAGGNLSEVINALPHLENVMLSNANLSGPVPSISGIQSLQGLWLNNNQLTGSVPSKIPNSLQQLVLSNNKLTGSLATLLPTNPGDSALMRLDLAGNDLQGSLPLDLGTHPNIKYITLQGNRLNGSLHSTVSRYSCKESL